MNAASIYFLFNFRGLSKPNEMRTAIAHNRAVLYPDLSTEAHEDTNHWDESHTIAEQIRPIFRLQ